GSAMTEKKAGASNLVMRLATAVVGVPAILALIYPAPAWGFYLLVLGAALVGSAELFAMTHPGDRVSQAFGVLLTAGASAAFYFFHRDPKVIATVLVAIPLLGPLLTLVRLGDMSSAALRASALGFGPLFVGIPLTMLGLFRVDYPGTEGSGFVVLAIGCAWL